MADETLGGGSSTGPRTMAQASRAVVVGGGVGGLVAAAELAHRGVAVTLVERSRHVGGKIRVASLAGREVDVGPTVLTMRWVFDGILADLGERLDDRVQLRQADLLARHAWSDGGCLDLFADEDRSAKAVEDLAGAEEAAGFRAFCAHCRCIYDACERPFICSPEASLLTMVRAAGLRPLSTLRQTDGLRTMDKALRGFFRDRRLRQLFARYATYYGSSPFAAPATLCLIAHVEQQGVWTVDGGMKSLALGLARLGEERGVGLRLGCAAQWVEVVDDRVRAVHLEDGTALRADAVVVNADVAAVGAGLLGSDVCQVGRIVEPSRRSLSALTVAAVTRPQGFGLVRHNVFFSDDYEAEFDDILVRGRLPRKPTVYVCAQDRYDEPLSHDEHQEGGEAERVFVIINAPASGDVRRFDEREVQACVQSAVGQLAQAGLQLDLKGAKPCISQPQDFHRAFPATGGALYGEATHSFMAPLTRRGVRTGIKGLYLAGGSVHPGAGVPMAALSGRHAASSVLADLGLTSLCPLPGMRGGTSTG